jgi:hypothetical protein
MNMNMNMNMDMNMSTGMNTHLEHQRMHEQSVYGAMGAPCHPKPANQQQFVHQHTCMHVDTLSPLPHCTTHITHTFQIPSCAGSVTNCAAHSPCAQHMRHNQAVYIHSLGTSVQTKHVTQARTHNTHSPSPTMPRNPPIRIKSKINTIQTSKMLHTFGNTQNITYHRLHVTTEATGPVPAAWQHCYGPFAHTSPIHAKYCVHTT